ncbi:MAG: ArsR/SmtB family transcription factor [Candidatus Sumerlaeaceae bacterium]|jgi:ArsR family transcriptional regulator
MAAQNKKRLAREVFEIVAEHFAALADVNRLRILQELGDGPRTVSDLCRTLNLTQPNTSAHLAVLRGAGLVVGTRRGKNVIYSLADETVSNLCELVCRCIREKQNRLHALIEEETGPPKLQLTSHHQSERGR